MRIYVVALMLCASAALAAFIWSGPSEIRHYTAGELSEMTCEALGESHTEVIDAYHDAEIAHFRKAGAFHDDLGLPPEDVVPYAVLMTRFMRDHDIDKTDVITRSMPTPLLYSDFYYEISGTCAANPSWKAVEAMRQAALNLSLISRNETNWAEGNETKIGVVSRLLLRPCQHHGAGGLSGRTGTLHILPD